MGHLGPDGPLQTHVGLIWGTWAPHSPSKNQMGPRYFASWVWLNSLDNINRVIIPSDPNALLERLDLLMASKGAGNTGVGNEIVSICDKLKRQNILDVNAYTNLMSSL